jgi:hypothetical protein
MTARRLSYDILCQLTSLHETPQVHPTGTGQGIANVIHLDDSTGGDHIEAAIR